MLDESKCGLMWILMLFFMYLHFQTVYLSLLQFKRWFWSCDPDLVGDNSHKPNTFSASFPKMRNIGSRIQKCRWVLLARSLPTCNEEGVRSNTYLNVLFNIFFFPSGLLAEIFEQDTITIELLVAVCHAKGLNTVGCFIKLTAVLTAEISQNLADNEEFQKQSVLLQ